MVFTILTIIGIIIFIISRKITSPELVGLKKVLPFAAIILVIIGFFSSTAVVIGAGKVGVESLFGKVYTEPLYSGLHFINPFAEVREVSIQTETYTMSGTHSEGKVQGDDAIRVLAADGLQVGMDLSVLYSVIPSDAPKLFTTVGLSYEDKIVRPTSRASLRSLSGQYASVELYSVKKEEFHTKLFESLDKEFKARGLKLESILIRNIDLPGSVKTSIEDKINAEMAAQKMVFVLQKETQEAERKRVEAQGIADYQRIINVGLTAQQIEYEQIKANLELARSANSKVIVLGNNKTSLILGNQ